MNPNKLLGRQNRLGRVYSYITLGDVKSHSKRKNVRLLAGTRRFQKSICFFFFFNLLFKMEMELLRWRTPIDHQPIGYCVIQQVKRNEKERNGGTN